MPIQQIITAPARILQLTSVQKRDTPTALPEMPDGVEVFTFPAQISSTRLDAYSTHMAESTLANFEREARAGVSFLDSHVTDRLGFGQSYDAVFAREGEGDTLQTGEVIAYFYTVPGIEFGGQHSYRSTDDFIKAVRSRLVRDVSVGFYGGWYRCDVCQRDLLFDPECPHFPGLETIVAEQRIIATAAVEDAQLAEVSAVYDGATPMAGIIQKANFLASDGRLSGKQRGQIERQLRIHLPDKTFVTTAVALDGAGDTEGADEMTMKRSKAQSRAATEETDATRVEEAEDVATGVDETAVDETETATEDTFVDDASDVDADVDTDAAADEEEGDDERRPRSRQPSMARAVQTALVTAGAPDTGTEGERILWLGDEIRRMARVNLAQKRQIEELTPLADDGRTYRNDIIEEAIRMGVKALGDNFPADTYRAMLGAESATLDHIKSVRDSLADQAAARFSGGRKTPTTPQRPDEGTAKHNNESLYRIP